MLDVFTLAGQDTNLRRKTYKEQSGPCPDSSCRCQHDGFNVKFNGEKWVFMCRGCWDSEEILADKQRKRGWGDELDYLRHFRKMSYRKAIALLLQEGNISFDDAVTRLSIGQWTSEDARAYLLNNGATGDEKGKPVVKGQQPTHLDYHSDAWQSQAAAAMKEYINSLWSDEGRYALDYARSRGFTDDMIRGASFGYSEKNGIPRLLIPSIHKRRCVAIYRRDLRPDVPGRERWKDARGSAGDIPYQADCLVHKRITIMTEASLDALSIIQEVGIETYNVIATGGRGKCRTIELIALLARMPLVLIAFDADEKGDEGAKWWLDRLTNARRLRPYLKDVNDMLVSDWDIRDWVLNGLAAATSSTAEEAAIGQQCCVCGAEIDNPCYEFYFDSRGILYCNNHWPGEKSA